jgi:hypothetical protein
MPSRDVFITRAGEPGTAGVFAGAIGPGMTGAVGTGVAGVHKEVGIVAQAAPAMRAQRVDPPNRESLGKRTIEGVEAEGTRTTFTIPAGQIGNERPIEIVSEQWYSPELQTMVMTRRSDPRMGETTYKLTRIDRTEPMRSLFEVPPDYTVKEEQPHMIPFQHKIERKQDK